jgi:hypothetical protein
MGFASNSAVSVWKNHAILADRGSLTQVDCRNSSALSHFKFVQCTPKLSEDRGQEPGRLAVTRNHRNLSA